MIKTNAKMLVNVYFIFLCFVASFVINTGQFVVARVTQADFTRLAQYMCATSLSTDHPCFEITLTDLDPQKLAGIGLVHNNYNITRMPGWEAGSIAWHFDNGKYVDLKKHTLSINYVD